MKTTTITKIIKSVYDWITELEYISEVSNVSTNDEHDGYYMHSVSAPPSTGVMYYMTTDWAYSEDIIIRVCSNEIDIVRTVHDGTICLGYKHELTVRIDKKPVCEITAELMFALTETLKHCH